MQLDLTPPARVGFGNALFLADLAENVPDEELRANIKRGKYPELAMRFVAGWRKLRGRA